MVRGPVLVYNKISTEIESDYSETLKATRPRCDIQVGDQWTLIDQVKLPQ